MATRIEEKVSKGFIHFSAILEIVGKPKEHVDSTFLDFIAQMKKSLKYEIVSESVNESIPVEGSENLFSSYAELEVLAKDMGALFDFCFECMPASVEILAPAELKLKPNQASAAVNDLIGRVHHLDMHSKQLTQRMELQMQNIRVMIENAVVIYLAQKPHRAEEISSAVGVPVAQLTSFLNHLVETKRVVVSDGVYGVAGRTIKKNEIETESTPALTVDSKSSDKKSKSKKSKQKEDIIKIVKKK